MVKIKKEKKKLNKSGESRKVTASRIKKISSVKKVKTVSAPKHKKILVKSKKNKPKNKRIIPKKVPVKYNKEKFIKLEKSWKNPILSPRLYSWESQAAFNPGAVYSDGRVHLFYRALGGDGISRIGYASSKDGVNFDERLFYPIYSMRSAEETKKHWPFTSPARPAYDNTLYASGGGWGGCEDPRSVIIEGQLYLTLNIFDGWGSMRVAVISIKEEDLLNKKWNWGPLAYLSRPGDRQKNWVLFPEKINGKFAIFHNLDLGDPSRVGVTYVNKLDNSETPQGSAPGSDAPDPQRLPDHIVAWHKHTRSAACPPIKTKDGWLLLYHAMDKDGDNSYKLGAMLLDLKDPTKVLYRASHTILEAEEWYENDWKPGIIYASGAIIKNGKLFVYYGGGDKHVGVASIKLSTLIDSMKNDGKVKLEKNNKIEF